MTPLSFDYPITVAILYYTGLLPDVKDCEETAENLTRALEDRGHRVRAVRVTEKSWREAIKTPGEVVFNLVEDESWELYSKVGLALERLGRAQLGHDVKTFGYANHKAWIKRKLHRYGISTPNFRIVNRRSKINYVRGLEYPLIVKPSRQHAAIGISQDSVVIDSQELEEGIKYLFKHYPGEVIVEEFIDGRELSATVIGNGRHAVVLPYIERVFTGEFSDNWNIYTYNGKWEESSWEFWASKIVCPVRTGQLLEKRLDRLSLNAYRAFGCRDIARLDIRVDQNEKPYLIDVNVNPGVDKHDQEEVWRSAQALGWTYADLVETLVAVTYKRVYHRLPDRTRESSFLLDFVSSP